MGRSAGVCQVERLAQPTERIGLREWNESRRWSKRQDRGGILRYARDDRWGRRVRCGQRVFVGRGLELEMGRGRRKNQVPRCARNDNLREFRQVAEEWLWLRDSALLRVEAGSMAWRRRVVGLGFVAGRAGVEVGVIRTVQVRDRAGSGSHSCR